MILRKDYTVTKVKNSRLAVTLKRTLFQSSC